MILWKQCKVCKDAIPIEIIHTEGGHPVHDAYLCGECAICGSGRRQAGFSALLFFAFLVSMIAIGWILAEPIDRLVPSTEYRVPSHGPPPQNSALRTQH